jgi:serine protease
VTPPMWNRLGHAQYPAVPAGRVVEVSSPGITWAQAAIPGPGHYCFVATVGAAGDPEPAPGNFADFNAFMAYILANGNITWRNFNVVAMALSSKKRPAHFEPLPFLITGAWDRPLAFQLEILADLPAKSQLALQVPAWLGHELKPAPANLADHEDADADTDERHKVRIRLDPRGAQSLGQVTLPADVRARSHLLVQLPAGQGRKAGDVVIRQLLAGQEVGRITWRLIPRAHGSRSEEERE